MQIKKCTPEDIDTLQAIALSTFKHTYEHKNTPENFKKYIDNAFNRERLLMELANPEIGYFLALLEGEVVGYIKLNEGDTQTEIYENALEIERIYVLQKHKRKGLGRQFLDHALTVAKAKGKKMLWLGVWAENPAAIQFYERYGMHQFGEHSFFMGDEEQKDFLMKIELPWPF